MSKPEFAYLPEGEKPEGDGWQITHMIASSKADGRQRVWIRGLLKDDGGFQLPTISLDGPHKPNDHRVWLARQLLDSKLTDEEAYGIVCWSPAVSAIWRGC